MEAVFVVFFALAALMVVAYVIVAALLYYAGARMIFGMVKDMAREFAPEKREQQPEPDTLLRPASPPDTLLRPMG